ncbi:Uncharacterised protein [Mycoplasmopsis maculosa]|uniref:Uncharacterized protein n=1 Tax=Mycoplasmopsis maculosa TaxID=114885 RepID=A0A449B5F0_9BACT|nr:hypothetical protein [Mycoplasmopsis maculosa]VEU75799.1 Uncharacterised protein [Mycoplasmopsis maculosa]
MKFATISQVLPAIVSLATLNVNLSLNENKYLKIKKVILNVSKIKLPEWVVVYESNLICRYSNRGVGGKNLVFRNITTNEEKTIDKIFKYSNDQLAIWSLIKVYFKSQDWFIKTFPNKLKKRII